MDWLDNLLRYESCIEWFLVLNRFDLLNLIIEFLVDKKFKLDR